MMNMPDDVEELDSMNERSTNASRNLQLPSFHTHVSSTRLYT